MITEEYLTDEKTRPGALRSYEMLEDEPNQALDELTELVAKLCETPFAAITIIEEKRQLFKARYGHAVHSLAAHASLCTGDLEAGNTVIVPDIGLDDRFPGTSMGFEGSQIRFYAAVPLLAPGEGVIGALCVMDIVPRQLSALQEETLRVTARQVTAQLELHRQSRKMAAKEARLRIALEAAQMSPFEWDIHEDMIVRFPSGDEMLGFEPGQFDGSFRMFSEQIHPDDLDGLNAALESAMMHRTSVVHEFRIRKPGGEIRWISGHGEYSYNEAGVPTLMFGVILDVTDRKRSELHMQHLNRVYAVLGEVNHAITREPVAGKLLEASCRIAVEKGGYQMAWIGMRESPCAALQVAAYAGEIESIRTDIEAFLARECTSGCQCTSETYNIGEYQVCNDLKNATGSEAWKTSAIEHGLHSMASFPIKVDGETLGIFNIYSNETNFFDNEELKLLDELAIDISLALEIRKREAEKREVNQALEKSEEQLSTAIKIARLSHWEYDLKTDLFHFNDHFYQLLRTTAEEEGGYYMSPDRYAERFLPPEDRPLVRSESKKAITSTEENYSTQLEHRINFGDGTTGYVSVRIFTERDEEGHLTGYYGVNQDITERKLAEEAVKEAERRFRALIEHSADSICLADRDGNILYLSPSVASVEGYDPRELTGKPAFENVHPDDLPQLKETRETLLANPNEPLPVLWRGRHRDGHWLWLEGVSINLLDDPAVGAIVTNYRDITQRRELENDLRQAQKMEAIGQLAGGVAHDFNNLLTVIHGYGSLLLSSERDRSKDRESASLVVQAAERAVSLTRQLLAFSRRQVMQACDLDLNENVTKVTRMLQRILGEDVEFEQHTCPSELWVHADPGMLDQILLNLAVNARDAMPGGGRLTIETNRRQLNEDAASAIPDCSPGNYVTLRVTDTGCGIAPEDITRIFEPFFTTKDPGKGTGLGLSTVFGIVKQHEGTILVESEPGAGTTFEILLPECQQGTATKSGKSGTDKMQGGKENILLVEDENIVRQLVGNILKRAGYSVWEAADGNEALKIWEQRSGNFDLLFTDIVMPGGISGLDLSKEMRENSPDLKVIYTSGYSADIAGQELSLRPGENFIQKPVPIYDLLKTVRRCLDHAN